MDTQTTAELVITCSPIEYRPAEVTAETVERDHAIALALHTEGRDHLAETYRNASTVAQREALTDMAWLDDRTIEAARHALIEQGWASI